MRTAAARVLLMAACLALVTAAARIAPADPASVAAPATQPAEAQPPEAPEDVFTDRGLTHMGFWLILSDEPDIHNDVWKLKRAKAATANGASQRGNAEASLQKGQDALEQVENQYKTLSAKLTAAAAVRQGINSQSNPTAYNQAVEQYNDLLDQRNSLLLELQKQSNDLKLAQDHEGDVTNTGSAYINLEIELSGKAEALAKTYATLKKDAVLRAAIAQYNQDNHVHSRLGPSGIFVEDLAFIRKCEKDVSSGIVSVTTGEGGGPVVQAVINGKVTESMIWDSGATIVTISAATADKLGLDLTASKQTIQLVVANGKKLKAKIVSLDSIQLGPYTVKDVQCAVLPAQFKGTDDLLGDTFQSRFICRLDQAAGQLQLTPVDPSVTKGPAAERMPTPSAGN